MGVNRDVLGFWQADRYRCNPQEGRGEDEKRNIKRNMEEANCKESNWSDLAQYRVMWRQEPPGQLINQSFFFDRDQLAVTTVTRQNLLRFTPVTANRNDRVENNYGN